MSLHKVFIKSVSCDSLYITHDPKLSDLLLACLCFVAWQVRADLRIRKGYKLITPSIFSNGLRYARSFVPQMLFEHMLYSENFKLILRKLRPDVDC
jgi:hypothetical protein